MQTLSRRLEVKGRPRPAVHFPPPLSYQSPAGVQSNRRRPAERWTQISLKALDASRESTLATGPRPTGNGVSPARQCIMHSGPDMEKDRQYAISHVLPDALNIFLQQWTAVKYCVIYPDIFLSHHQAAINRLAWNEPFFVHYRVKFFCERALRKMISPWR